MTKRIMLVAYKSWAAVAHIEGCASLRRAKAPWESDPRGWESYSVDRYRAEGRIIRPCEHCYWDVEDAIDAATGRKPRL